MNIKTTLTGSALLLISVAVQADDSAQSFDPVMQQTQTQMQNRIKSMSADEQALHQQLNDTGRDNTYSQANGERKGSGDSKRLRDGSGYGSGKKNRYGQSDAGNGSHQGGGRGRR